MISALVSKGKSYTYRAVRGWAMPQDERFAYLKNQKIDLKRE